MEPTHSSDDEQILRGEDRAGLNRGHRDGGRLRSVGAEIERLVRAIEVEYGTRAVPVGTRTIE